MSWGVFRLEVLTMVGDGERDGLSAHGLVCARGRGGAVVDDGSEGRCESEWLWSKEDVLSESLSCCRFTWPRMC